MTTSAQATNSNRNNNNNNNETSTTTTTSTTSNENCIKLELWPPLTPTSIAMQEPATTTQPLSVVAPHLTINSSTVPLPALITSTNRVMQADEDFNIRFVNLVRLHRCLYDKKVPEYRNRDNQEKAWVLISQETRESVIHCKERWRNLRACLSRYIKQQSGSEPQHKPYYLTEHMAFLLPFLKSARSSLESNSSLTTLYQLSQEQQQNNTLQTLTAASQLQQLNNGAQQKLEFKQSLSENDEETIDAFDPAITASLGLQRINASNSVTEVTAGALSPALSDTASANTLQNFIPDVQLAESGPDLIYHPHTHVSSQQQQHHHHSSHHHRRCESRGYDTCSSPAIKRIKTECEPSTSGQFYGLGGGSSSAADGTEHADMEFFRSILPDLAALTPQQKRKFKIGILELIDDVVERYPANSTNLEPSGSVNSVNDGYGNVNGSMANGLSNGTSRASARKIRRNSTRDSNWRK